MLVSGRQPSDLHGEEEEEEEEEEEDDDDDIVSRIFIYICIFILGCGGVWSGSASVVQSDSTGRYPELRRMRT